MNVWLPSASVMNPSPPEICWHLMAPFTVPAIGVTKSPCVPLGTPTVGGLNCVGPLYKGSVLLHLGPVGFVPQLVPVNGWVMVEVGHCTRNDWALAATVANATRRMGIQTCNDFLMAVQPPSYAGPRPTTTTYNSLAVMLLPRRIYREHLRSNLLISSDPTFSYSSSIRTC